MPASCLREIPDLRDVWPAHAVLHGTSHRRTDLEQLDVGVGAWKRLPQIFLELRLDEVARLYAALGHNHLLAKPCIGRLHVERQHEPRRAGADISRPMLHGAIALQLLALEARHLRIGVCNRGILRQIPVDHQLVTVRRGKELLLHECHAEQRDEEGCNRHADGDPAVMHADEQQAGEHLRQPALLPVVALHLCGQNGDAEQRGEQHRDDPRHDQGDRNHHEQGEGKFTGIAAVQPNRDEARDGDQRARQHGKSGRRIDVGRCLFQGIADLQPGHHHFDGNHGVIDQKAQRDDQCTKRNSLQ